MDMMVDLTDTIVDLTDTMVDLMDTMADLGHSGMEGVPDDDSHSQSGGIKINETDGAPHSHSNQYVMPPFDCAACCGIVC